MYPVLLKPLEICTPYVPRASASIQWLDEDGPSGMSLGCWLPDSERPSEHRWEWSLLYCWSPLGYACHIFQHQHSGQRRASSGERLPEPGGNSQLPINTRESEICAPEAPWHMHTTYLRRHQRQHSGQGRMCLADVIKELAGWTRKKQPVPNEQRQEWCLLCSLSLLGYACHISQGTFALIQRLEDDEPGGLHQGPSCLNQEKTAGSQWCHKG